LEKTRDREELSLVERTYDKFRMSFAAIRTKFGIRPRTRY